jgi:hypothetical protein
VEVGGEWEWTKRGRGNLMKLTSWCVKKCVRYRVSKIFTLHSTRTISTLPIRASAKLRRKVMRTFNQNKRIRDSERDRATTAQLMRCAPKVEKVRLRFAMILKRLTRERRGQCAHPVDILVVVARASSCHISPHEMRERSKFNTRLRTEVKRNDSAFRLTRPLVPVGQCVLC